MNFWQNFVEGSKYSTLGNPSFLFAHKEKLPLDHQAYSNKRSYLCKMKKLPVGIQDFNKLITGGYLYVDKTKSIVELLTSGEYYFLTRPRRFGKSLLLTTIKEIFEGNKKVFKGLWIENKWDWSTKHPVIHISFNGIGHKFIGLEKALNAEVYKLALEKGFQLLEEGFVRRFQELIEKTAKKHGQVVLLIDEYNKPIIDYLGEKQLQQAQANQEILKSFYSVLKPLDSKIKFLLITGVSKFSKTGIFSELNNLADITLERRFASLTGYTQEELDHYFEPFKDLACEQNDLNREQLSEKLKLWYNGYSWDTKTFVYNPFSILRFFQACDFMNFWFSTGTPTFLIKLLKKRFYYDFDGIEMGQSAFESHDIKYIETDSLLFQTGYLTLKEKRRNIYRLGYPNLEVKESMLQHLMGAFRHGESGKSSTIAYYIEEAFNKGDLEEVFDRINNMFASIPYALFEKQQEKYYHSLVHILFTYLGIYIQSEVNTSKGRIDAVVQTDDHIYILEFKLDKSPDLAIQQIQEKGYADKYLDTNKKILAVGVCFGRKEKEIIDWKAVEIKTSE